MSVKLTTSKSQIIPAILTTSPQDFTKKLEFARSVGSVHLDVIDGTFCPGAALEIEKWPNLDIDYSEAHLMVRSPLSYLERLAEKGVTRAIVHIEAEFGREELEQKARELDLLLGYAVNPDTDLLLLKKYIDTNSYIQIMGVDPGREGQRMYTQTPLAVSYIQKTSARRVIISVDGGINPETIKSLVDADANYFIESHAIFYRRPYEENYQAMVTELKQLVGAE